MNSIYAIIVFLCVQELTTASYYRQPKRYFKSPKQERKQTNNVPLNYPARNTPVFPPISEKSAQISEEILTVKSEIHEVVSNDEQIPILNDEQIPILNDEQIPILNEEQITILRPCKPILRQDLPIMTTLPILTILPIVASLPVVNIKPKVKEEVASLDEVDLPNYSLDVEEEIEEVDESTVSVNILQEVKYEIAERKPRKSQILHKIHRIEEFKRNIFIDRQRGKTQNTEFY